MSEDQSISIAGVRVALGPIGLPAALGPWRVTPRAQDLRFHMRHGQPLAAPSATGHGATTRLPHGLDVAVRRDRYHLIVRDEAGRIERSAVFDPRANSGEIVLAPHVDPASGDEGILEWLVLVQLARAGGFVLDACAGVKEGKALVFAAAPDSNALPVAADLLRWHPDARLIADRRVAVHFSRGLGWVATRWPWPLTSSSAPRGSGAVQAIHRIHRAAGIVAEPLVGERALHTIGEVCVRPSGHVPADAEIDIALERCIEAVPTIELGFPPDARFSTYAFGRASARENARHATVAQR